MKLFLEFLYENQLLHWLSALVGLFTLIYVRLRGVKKFSLRIWLEENLIQFIWSLFVVSFFVPLLAIYLPAFTLVAAFFGGYSASHLVFKFNH
jgi:hypothetical protein